MKSVNFEYIRSIPGFEGLHKACKEAEMFVYQFPDISLFSTRRAMEFVVKMLYGSAINTLIDRMNVYDMLSDPDFVRYIDDRALLNAIHHIRKLGNQAVHQGSLTVQEAKEALRLLHYICGEVCVFLDLVKGYSNFKEIEKTNSFAAPPNAEQDDLSVEEKLLIALSGRIKGVPSFSRKKEVVNVHVATKNATKPSGKSANIDSAANSRAAFSAVHELLEEVLKFGVRADYSKLLLAYNSNGRVVIMTVRTGCSNLGSKDSDGNWNLLPGVDFIVYAPSLHQELPIIEQLRLFSRKEFLNMWESLGLIRYKVSFSLSSKLKQEYGNDYVVSIFDYADTASIQSFGNSGKKKLEVQEHFKKFPLLSSQEALKALQISALTARENESCRSCKHSQ